MAKEFKLTQESLTKLKEELEYLKTVREKEVAEQIKEARSFGDLSENSEYDEAKTSRVSCIPVSQSWRTSWRMRSSSPTTCMARMRFRPAAVLR